MAEPTIQLGGGNWAGKTDNLLGYYKEGKRFYKQDFTFSRSTTGTYTDSDGYIQEMPYNLNNNSEDLNSYTKLNVVVTSDDIISPRGTQDADKLETTSNNSYKLLKTNSVSFVSGVDYTFSFHAKKGTTDFIQLITTNTLFGATSEWANFDLNNGVVSLDNYGGASIEDVGNGWFRCSITSTCVSSGTDGWFVSVITSGTSTRAESTSNVVNVYAWGIQVVKGTTAKTYFPTTTRLNMPRVDYLNNSNGSLILEPQRTNTIPNSEDISQNSVLNNASVTTDQTTSPSNINNADKVTFGNLSGFFYKNANITAASTFSIFLKYDDYQYFQLMGTGDVDHYANFDIQNGVLGNVGSQATAKIEDYGNGWYRCSLSMYAGTFAGGQRVYKTNSLTASWAGGGGGAGNVFAWGMQLESGGSYATSYIPTLGSSVTRNQDTCSITNVADRINSSEGVLFADIAALDNDSTYRLISIENTSDAANNFIYLGYNNSSNTIRTRIEVAGSAVTDMQFALSDETEFNKCAVKWNENDFALWVNGVEVATDSSGSTFSSNTLDRLSFNRNSTLEFLGNVKQLQVYKTALSDSELATLTT